MEPFLPTGGVTGIGSLPHLDPDDAIAFIAEFSPTVPFWPQLPQRSPSEVLIAQMLSPLLDLLDEHDQAHFEIKPGKLDEFRKRLRVADAVFPESAAAGFFAFERACRANKFPDAVAFKGQVTGPITLGWCLFQDEQPLWILPELFAELVDYVSSLASWQIFRLSCFDKPVLLFIDEPMLALEGSPAYVTDGLKRVIAAIRRAGAYAGIHCCATPAPVSICSLQPDIVSFDAHQGLEMLLAQPDTRTFVENGGCLSFGLVPTLNALNSFDPSETFIRWATAVGETLPAKKFADQSMVTATCGLGLMSIEAAQASFRKAIELSHLIAKVAVYGN